MILYYFGNVLLDLSATSLWSPQPLCLRASIVSVFAVPLFVFCLLCWVLVYSSSSVSGTCVTVRVVSQSILSACSKCLFCVLRHCLPYVLACACATFPTRSLSVMLSLILGRMDTCPTIYTRHLIVVNYG